MTKTVNKEKELRKKLKAEKKAEKKARWPELEPGKKRAMMWIGIVILVVFIIGITLGALTYAGVIDFTDQQALWKANRA